MLILVKNLKFLEILFILILIEHLKDVNDFECRSEDGLEHIARDYFMQFFSKIKWLSCQCY